MRVIAVTENHGVDVAIPETGQHIHAFGGNDFRILRNRKCTDRADFRYAFAINQNDAVREWEFPKSSINRPPTSATVRACANAVASSESKSASRNP